MNSTVTLIVNIRTAKNDGACDLAAAAARVRVQMLAGRTDARSLRDVDALNRAICGRNKREQSIAAHGRDYRMAMELRVMA